MVQIFAVLKDGRFYVGSTSEAKSATLGIWPEEFSIQNFNLDYEIAWIDLVKPTPEELSWLGTKFHFHPLAIEDCAHFDQRPKIEEYSDHLFLVVHGLKTGTDKELDFYELHAFLAKNVIVTVHDEPIDALENLKQKIGRNRNQLPVQVDFLLHKILDTVMDANPAALNAIEREIETLDEQVIQRTSAVYIERIHELQRQLNAVRHILFPQREIFLNMVKGEYDQVTERAQVYYRDIYDHLVSLSEMVDELRETLWGIRDAYLAFAAHKSNEAMKRLTVFSVIFLPLTFITGFFGMNFEHISWTDNFTFYGTLAIIFTLPVGMLVYFNRKDWL